MREEAVQKKMVQFFSSLADETRLKILVSLFEKEKSVSEIHAFFEDSLTLSAISHQLKVLRSSEVVQCKKHGREKFYSLSGDFCWCILKDASNHFGDKKKSKMRIKKK